jgi:hypothetical protein
MGRSFETYAHFAAAIRSFAARLADWRSSVVRPACLTALAAAAWFPGGAPAHGRNEMPCGQAATGDAAFAGTGPISILGRSGPFAWTNESPSEEPQSIVKPWSLDDGPTIVVRSQPGQLPVSASSAVVQTSTASVSNLGATALVATAWDEPWGSPADREVAVSVVRPWHWTNPADAPSITPVPQNKPTPRTSEEIIAAERQGALWLRPFYWQNEVGGDAGGADVAAAANRQSAKSPRDRAIASHNPFTWSNDPASAPNPAVQVAQRTPSPSPVGPERSGGLLQASASEEADPAADQLPSPAEGEALPPALAGEAAPEGVAGAESAPADAAKGDDKAKGLAEADKLGEEPTDNSLQFLRSSTVLLSPGDMQFDYGVSYALIDQDLPVINSSNDVELARLRQRNLVSPFEVRYGIARRVQGYVNLPVGWSNSEFTYSEFEDFRNDGGIGDLSFGSSLLLREATPCTSDVILTVGATAPTGLEPFVGLAQTPGVPSLGQGVWSLNANLLWVRNYDPLVLFYGIGTRQYFERNINGVDYLPGQQYNYLMGVGFAVNEKVTLSTRFYGAYITETELNGQRVRGSILEPMTVELAATVSKCKKLVEPFVRFGVTDDGLDSNVGIVWTLY